MSTPTEPLRDLSRLCIHTITTKSWAFEHAVERYAALGAKGITVWRQALEGRDVAACGRIIRESGLSVVSLCRGGFFAGDTLQLRTRAIDENRRCIDEAAALGVPLIVLVCGATPTQSLTESRRQITEAISVLAPYAASAQIKLAIEPLHPMYAGDRSAVNTIAQARAICRQIGSPSVGIAIDVYHVWWDEGLEGEISECGREGRIFAFHVCDWLTPTVDLLNDRGLMGEGCIPLRQIRGWIEQAGYRGFNEVEIFSDRLWASDQDRFLEAIKTAYLAHT